jgi:hypothetical protein
MSVKRRWLLLALGSLIAAAAIGSWGCCTVTCCEPKAKIQFVEVEPGTLNVRTDPVVISKKRNQEILWRLPADSTVVAVEITLGANPAPFEDCETGVAGVCRLPCHGRVCASGPIDPNLQVETKLYYDYRFRKADQTASVHPTIRIDP